MHRLFASCAAALIAAALLTMPTVPPAFDGQAMAQTRGDEEGASDRLDERRFRSPYDPPPTVDQDREAQSRAEARRDAERRQARREAEERRLIEEHYRRKQRQRDGDLCAAADRMPGHRGRGTFGDGVLWPRGTGRTPHDFLARLLPGRPITGPANRAPVS